MALLIVSSRILVWGAVEIARGFGVSDLIIGYGFWGPGRINRIEGAVLLACYVGYTAYLISTVFDGQV